MLKPESFPIFADWAHGDYVCESVLLLLTSDYSVKEMLGGAGIANVSPHDHFRESPKEVMSTNYC